MKLNSCCCGWSGAALLALLLSAAAAGCKGWNPMGGGQPATQGSSVYDDPSFELPATVGSRATTSARPGGFSKEARAIEARLGIQ